MNLKKEDKRINGYIRVNKIEIAITQTSKFLAFVFQTGFNILSCKVISLLDAVNVNAIYDLLIHEITHILLCADCL